MNIPGEGTPAGDALALVVALAPLTAIIVSASLRPRALAFFSALLASGGIVVYGTRYAMTSAPEPGTEFAAKVFGGWGAGISLFMIVIVTVGRGFLARSSTVTGPKTPSQPEA